MDAYDYKAAIQVADLALATDSGNIRLLLLKSKSLSALNQYKPAWETLKKANALDSLNIFLLAEMSSLSQKKGDLKSAILYCRKASNIEPENVFFKMQLAGIYYSTEKYHDCLALLIPLYQSDSTNQYVARLIADCYYDTKANDAAILWYQKILTSSPYDLYATQKLANIYIRTDDVATGLQLTERYIQKDTALNPVHKMNAYFYHLAKDYNTAKTRFLSCLQAGDSSMFVYRKLGLTYYKQEVFDSAELYFRKAYFLDTTDAETCFYFGVSASRSYLPDTGARYLNKTFQKVMPSETFLINIYSELAEAYNNRRMPDTALAILEKGLAVFPENKRLIFRIAYQLDQLLNKPQQSMPYYERFLKDVVVSENENSMGTEVSYETFARNRLAELKKKYNQ